MSATLTRDLNAEVQLLEVLFRAAEGKAKPTADVEAWAETHENMMAANKIVTSWDKFVTEMGSLKDHVTNKIVDEAVKNWKQWIASSAPPTKTDLSITTHASDPHRTYAPVGPFPIEQMQEPPALNLKAAPPQGAAAKVQIPMVDSPRALSLLDGKCSDPTLPPAWTSHASKGDDPLIPPEQYESLIKCTLKSRNMGNTNSPFAAGAATGEEGVAKRIFARYDLEYRAYTDGLSYQKTCEFDFDQLVQSVTKIRALQNQLESRKAAASECLQVQKSRLHNILNMNYTDGGRRYHRHVQVMRGSRPVLGLGTINTALVIQQSQGGEKAAEFLHKQNMNLKSVEEVNVALGAGMDVLRVKREVQRLNRGIDAVGELLEGKNKVGGLMAKDKDFDFEKAARDARKVLSEKIEYNPFEEPTLLVIETELELGLWSAQIPAIRSLAPKKEERRACLYELAMGMGKSAVITPAVINLLADGTTLPILVMPESLVPSMAAELQMQMGKGINREVRVLPIDRLNHTAAHIDHLTAELEMMIKEAVPLVWSSNDIQTLINSWIEDMEKQRCIDPTGKLKKKATCLVEGTIGGVEAAKAITKAWQRLFNLLRTKAEIVGDEIHAILDILTSYNFALGEPQKLQDDEMDAVTDFLLVVTNHQNITGSTWKAAPNRTATHFSFLRNDIPNVNKGTPLTAIHWKTELREIVADTLIKRGITNDRVCETFVREAKRCLPPPGPLEEDDTVTKCFSHTMTETTCADQCPGWSWGSIKGPLKAYLLSERDVHMDQIENIKLPIDPDPHGNNITLRIQSILNADDAVDIAHLAERNPERVRCAVFGSTLHTRGCNWFPRLLA
jgi:hypothetical protein